MVSFHVLKCIFSVDAVRDTQGTLMTLRFVGTEFLRFSERTKGQMLFIAPSAVREDERDDACFLGYIIIQHELLDVSFQSVANVLGFP